ncbi:hypothetical protein ACIBQ0_15540 [Nocardia nova]|uniref:hypothetical protein n=1 Tax=Nocardia nova TaxID=37330 RepID=UPI0037905EB0
MSKRYDIAVPLGAGLGCRQGEIVGFSPELDIDREAGVAHVQRQVKLVKGKLNVCPAQAGKDTLCAAGSGITG